ncbi:MAG: glycosyltransferase family 39 protein [Anaerolineae bacterium]|nr:glycosyltransferase family 39 protein [Anaerolineae bacterium]MDH7475345.1 glycosyltransferase family 39 protein [Anaerolineae bacterium]
MNWKRLELWIVAGTILANAAILFTSYTPLRYGAALLLLCLLPGLALVEALFAHRKTLPQVPNLREGEVVALSVGAGFAVTAPLTLLLHYLPGKMSPGVALAAYDLLILIPLGWRVYLTSSPPSSLPLSATERGRGAQGGRGEVRVLLVLAALLALAAFYRLANLDYAEFQGDEARVMMHAAQAIEGQEDALFKQHKGPLETLVPMGFWLLTGTINEAQARFPFALMNLAALLGVYLLARRWFGDAVALIATALLAINGFFIAFGRVVQYQSFVFGLGTLALLCGERFRTEGKGADLVLGGLLLGGGALAHYDVVAVGPAVLYLVVNGWRRQGAGARRTAPLLTAVVLGAIVVASFYLPYLRHPFFAETVNYLTGSRVEGWSLHNNLGDFFLTSTIYNSTYYVVALALLLGGVVVIYLSALSSRRGLFPALFVLGVGAVLMFPAAWRVGPVNLAVLPFLAVLAGLYLSPRADGTFRAALTWLAVPSLFYLFVVGYPLTHVYTLYPAWAVLGGLALVGLWRWLRGRWGRGAQAVLAVALAGWFITCAYYPLFVFVDHDPEYKRTYPAHRHPWYWTTYDELPAYGYFGFPYRAGWKVIGQLYADGVLHGDYNSNEEEEITNWYTRRAPRSYCPRPDYYFVAVNVQDEIPIPAGEVAAYHLAGVVTVGGEPKLRLYQRAVVESEPVVYAVEDFTSRYDRDTRPAAFFRPQELPAYTPLQADFAHQARLLGYILDASRAYPGGDLELTLIWQGLAAMDTDYHVFVHLEKEGHLWAQGDNAPGCGFKPTSGWAVGQVIVDPAYIVPIPEDMPPGEYSLLMGMYRMEDQIRLPVYDAEGEMPNRQVLIAEVRVGTPTKIANK